MNVAQAIDLYFEHSDEGRFPSIVAFVKHQIDDEAATEAYEAGVETVVRKALTSKGHRGLPRALSLNRVGVDGRKRRVYRPLRLFDVDDYRQACDAYGERAADQVRMRERLRRDCVTRYGIDPLEAS